MKKRQFLSMLCVVMICFAFSACANLNRPSKSAPVTLNMWHNYGGEMQKTMDELIDEFNSTVGAEQGINVTVTAISSSKELNSSLDMIVNDDPGAPEMPDICTAYPKTAIKFQQKNKIADFNEYFTQEELSEYVFSFVEEGKIANGLYVFPLAKSTEILYLNQTLFDEFADATGAQENKLSTFEGIAELSKMYYDWTDSKTPEVPNDGKAFYTADSWFNIAQVGLRQKGDSLFNEENELNLDNDTYKHILNTFYTPAAEGGVAIYDGYSSDLSKTGDLVCSTGSSAGILFYGDTITTSDNVTHKVKYSILPYPIVEGGEKVAIQRGSGIIVKKSEEKKEYAASVFVKWLTAPKQNMKFISQTGYLPVTKQAFEEDILKHIDKVENERIKEMLAAVMQMYKDYTFFTAPTFAEFDNISQEYEEDFKKALSDARQMRISGAETFVEEAFAKIK
ncbi:MAG: extracellular solute-binding protein [Clostridia bacterium]|nr:extracellular solute-binding protein [Clostridia bacterium]